MGTHHSIIPLQIYEEMLFSYNKWEFSSLHFWAQLYVFYYLLSPNMLINSPYFFFNYAGIPYSQM